MKEVTRIHIAKTSYDIETGAKKILETYLKTLEAYSDDTDIIEDIEIRITEILLERGVKKNGVITEADVKALKQQLGEPHEFMGEGDIAIGAIKHDSEDDDDISRKLYRNTENAVFGGVLSGIAAFFKINPVWVRLIFILVAFASFGTAILVYIVLWIAVPPAKTAADKLQMTGKPVTITSIRELNENEAGKPAGTSADVTARRVVTMLSGIACVIGALGAAGLTLVGAFAVAFGRHEIFNNAGAGFFIAAYVLAIVSGTLLTVLFILLAYASFAQKMTKRVLISTSVVIVLGLATFGTAVGLTQYGSVRYDNVIKANTHETTITFPSEGKNATSLTVDAPGVDVQYIVDLSRTTASMRAVSENANDGNAALTIEGKTLKLKATKVRSDMCVALWCDSPQQVVTIYGPALEQITTSQKSDIEYHPLTQKQLAVSTSESSDVTIAKGSIDTLVVDAADGSEVMASGAAVAHLQATVKNGVTLEFGTIETLALTDQKACPANSLSSIEVWKVSSGAITLNDVATEAHSKTLNCTKLSIESED
jgi:phage shock protein PspC (stress-responsive transcriptional regulator)